MAPTLGFEAAGGFAEKILPGVSFPVLMNTVLPGLLAGAALYPFVPPRWKGALSIDVEKSWPALVVAFLIVIIIGALLSAMNGEFYKIYEGRIFWPSRLFRRATARQQRRVDRLHDKADVQKGVNRQRYDELWYQLRIYPVHPETGRRYATHPTLLGNILAGYEEYPNDRYGMDSVFYWPRLWLLVDKDQKEDISKSWAVADGLLNFSAVSFLGGVVWLITVAGIILELWRAQWFSADMGLSFSTLATLGWFVLGYGFYRLSLSFHRQNGEIFKSLFDLYRSKLREIASLTPYESRLWRAAWAYLQYLRIPCPRCEIGTVSAITKDCSNQQCGAHVPEAIEEFRRTGKLFPIPNSSEVGKNICGLINELLARLRNNPEKR